jgi:hypothetical protein
MKQESLLITTAEAAKLLYEATNTSKMGDL